MLWLCLHLPHLAVELRQPSDAGPLAIIEHHGQRRRVLAANRAACAAGITPGMDATLAQGRLPALQLAPRAPAQERRALMALGRWAHQWSSDVCIDDARWLVTLEVGASLELFGGLERLRTRLLASVRALGYTPWPGIAPTPEGAALIACSGHPATLTSLHALRAELARRPLQDLCLDADSRQGLHAAGLTGIGELFQIPAAALARRFGPALPDYLQRLLGERPDPRRRLRLPERWRRTVECAYPVEHAQALLFPLRRMLGELQGWLRGHDGAVDAFSVTLRHRDAPPTRIDLRLGAPGRDATVFTPLLREHLERTVLPAPVLQLVLEAGPAVAPAITQHGLFDAHAVQDTQWVQLLDRLRARLGEDAVHELKLLDDHRPERAGCETRMPTTVPTAPSVTAPAVDRAPAAGAALPERPLWLLEPRPLRASPRLLGHPERIESGWWDGGEIRRDYYIAETVQGALWWVYRDLRTNAWFLHGIWA